MKENNDKKNQGYQLVLPLKNGKPFPTIFWLDHPTLKRELSKLESNGLIKYLEEELIPSDADFKKSLEEDHLRYQKRRIELFKENFPEQQDLPETMKKIIFETGIGGIQNFDRVKCLHLQYAYHLAEGNTVGRYLDENYNIKRFL